MSIITSEEVDPYVYFINLIALYVTELTLFFSKVKQILGIFINDYFVYSYR
jgi:hypothetical protein